MPDMAMISGVLTSLKAASDITKGLVSIRDATLLNEKIIELQQTILAAQSDALQANAEQFHLLTKINELEKKIFDVEAWSKEAERYSLIELYSGNLAYMIKPESRGSEPSHYICPTCFQKRRKSLLQGRTSMHGEHRLTCSACKTEVTHSFRPTRL